MSSNDSKFLDKMTNYKFENEIGEDEWVGLWIFFRTFHLQLVRRTVGSEVLWTGCRKEQLIIWVCVEREGAKKVSILTKKKSTFLLPRKIFSIFYNNYGYELVIFGWWIISRVNEPWFSLVHQTKFIKKKIFSLV